MQLSKLITPPAFYEVRCRQCKRLVEIVRSSDSVANLIRLFEDFYDHNAMLCEVTLGTMTLHLNQRPLACECRKEVSCTGSVVSVDS